MTQTKDREAILRMVAEGKVTPEEALELLEAMDEPPAPPLAPFMQPPSPPPFPALPAKRKRKFLRVIIKGTGGEENINVDVNVPLNLAEELASMLDRIIPENARDAINDKGVDFGAIAELISAIDEEAQEGKDIININTSDDNGEEVSMQIFVE